MLKKGEKLPDISLKDIHGKDVALHSYLGKPLVIYFYPKDNTKVCTAQACEFRDRYEEFQTMGAEVIGISTDSFHSHKRVSEKRNLPFLLLSDSKKKALEAFKVPSVLFGLMHGRVTVVFDKEGKVAHTFRADFNAEKHIAESLHILKEL